MWTQLETRLVDWERRFINIRTKETQDCLDIDREYMDREIPLLKAEKRSVEMRLRKIEELIAKAHILVDDLSEDLCHDLSAGHSLSAVGESLKEEFDRKMKKGHEEGRAAIRDFLEKHYRIGKAESRDLFSLLEESRVLNYRVDFPEDLKKAPLVWHPPEVDDLIYQLNGWWEIRA